MHRRSYLLSAWEVCNSVVVLVGLFVALAAFAVVSHPTTNYNICFKETHIPILSIMNHFNINFFRLDYYIFLKLLYFSLNF